MNYGRFKKLGENKMKKIVLCMDHGNSALEEVKKYLASHDCKVYTLPEGEDNVKALLTQIEQKEGSVDLLFFGVDEQIPEDGAVGTKHDYKMLLETVGGQVNCVQNTIEAALPLLRKGNLKRIGMITKKASSVSYCKDDHNYGQHMAWAGINMVGKIYFNLLRPEGFTFRWYCEGGNAGGMSAGEYLLSGLCYDPKEPYCHSDENRFVMRDSYLREIPW